MDEPVDDMNRAIQTELVAVMEQHPEVAVQSLNAIIVSRNLERAADHATNIAEDVIFWVRGADVRHKFSMIQSVEDRHLPIN
jgi:phosphate transport system protein